MEAGAVIEHGETSTSKAPPLPPPVGSGVKRVLSVADLVLRCRTGARVARVQCSADDNRRCVWMCRFFVVANSVVCGYLVLSLPASVMHVVRPRARCSRVVLVFFDTVMLALLTAGASAAAAIVYLAHRGSARANWSGICQQFTSFCERTTASLVGSFAAAVLLVVLVFLSPLALARRT
ncbi:hypothetical protein E2562_011089 [Oryza meyeriana var. granulata]|uniref:CASP-like protein n=1 Tax=Oryza meyeriana var. granulata TaxID=110450 RepID=A0A6G1EWK9_9ORYZ|nr:hypothetical protein E2562_011089 [Oryza meyeriana var. granulata]